MDFDEAMKVTKRRRPVRGAGGVPWRRVGSEVEVLLVHRPRYDDWTFPKGKAQSDEPDDACARREVEEETGLSCLMGAELASTAYVDHKGRPKVVRYWAMTPVSGTFRPCDEVDEVRWLTIADAERTLSYDHDREVLWSLADVPAVSEAS